MSTPPVCNPPRPQMEIIKAPSREAPKGLKSVFLAGTTTPFDGADWRGSLSASLTSLPITIYNPCNWDISWEADAGNESFSKQIEWEMDKQNVSDLIVIFFHPASQAPISLLELGMATRSPEKVIVACPEGYWKRGNVQVVCERFDIEIVETLDDLSDMVLNRLQQLLADTCSTKEKVLS